MATTFTKKAPAPKPPEPEAAPDLSSRVEAVDAPVSPVLDEPKKKGRPAGEPRDVFGTRLKAETIADVEALKAGLRLRMQGEAIERAVSFYKAHIIDKTRKELHLAPQMTDEAVLARAFKADD